MCKGVVVASRSRVFSLTPTQASCKTKTENCGKNRECEAWTCETTILESFSGPRLREVKGIANSRICLFFVVEIAVPLLARLLLSPVHRLLAVEGPVGILEGDERCVVTMQIVVIVLKKKKIT